MPSELRSESLPEPSRPHAFEAHGVCKRFGDRVVLDDVSFSVPEGEVLCLLGPNGAGKSTLVRIALGLLRADAGETRCGGRGIGYVPQTKAFSRSFPAKVEELVVANLRGRWPWRIRAAERAKVKAALGRVGAEHLLGASLTTLSGGELQRAFLARALVTDPKLLVLDEPETGVDVAGRDELTSLLRVLADEQQVAALIVTHHPELVAQVADRVVYLDRSVRAWGAPSEVLGALPNAQWPARLGAREGRSVSTAPTATTPTTPTATAPTTPTTPTAPTATTPTATAPTATAPTTPTAATPTAPAVTATTPDAPTATAPTTPDAPVAHDAPGGATDAERRR